MGWVIQDWAMTKSMGTWPTYLLFHAEFNDAIFVSFVVLWIQEKCGKENITFDELITAEPLVKVWLSARSRCGVNLPAIEKIFTYHGKFVPLLSQLLIIIFHFLFLLQVVMKNRYLLRMEKFNLKYVIYFPNINLCWLREEFIDCSKIQRWTLIIFDMAWQNVWMWFLFIFLHNL